MKFLRSRNLFLDFAPPLPTTKGQQRSQRAAHPPTPRAARTQTTSQRSAMPPPGGDHCRLTAITDIVELRQLRDLYRRDWPRHCVGFYCLANFIGWLERQQLHSTAQMKNLHIFTLDNDWRRDGLFLVVDRYQLFLNTLADASECTERLSAALSQLNWTWPGFKVSSFVERHRPAVMQVVRAKPVQVERDTRTPLYYLPCAAALQLEVNCPAGYRLHPLSQEDDAECIDSLWSSRHQGSRFLIRRLIAWNANVGVYAADSNELVAWCLRLQGGFLGALEVKASHRRMGLGSLVASATARLIAQQGDDVMALVDTDNPPSAGMFAKLGFKVTDNCYWLRTHPVAQCAKWPDDE